MVELIFIAINHSMFIQIATVIFLSFFLSLHEFQLQIVIIKVFVDCKNIKPFMHKHNLSEMLNEVMQVKRSRHI